MFSDAHALLVSDVPAAQKVPLLKGWRLLLLGLRLLPTDLDKGVALTGPQKLHIEAVLILNQHISCFNILISNG